jgi:V/A-type H+-transporting ATPase subunit E
MGLQAILEKIRNSGDAQIQELEKDTQARVNDILAQAQMEARQIEEDACANASAPAVAERARILHRARLEALRIVGEVRENLVDTAIARARERLAAFRADPAYASVLRALTEQALTELSADGVEKVQLLADPRDRALLDEILADMDLELLVSYSLNCWGGLIAKSSDGRVVVINTFESRLESGTAFLRSHLSLLFESEQSTVRDVINA